MNDIPRQKLKELIQRFGTSLSEDRLRCLGMLKDVCGEHKKEIAGIMAALDERIPAEILKPDFSVAITRKLLIKKLEDNRAIAHEVAEWSVDTWAIALGVMTESQFLTQVQPKATNMPTPEVQVQAQRQPTAPRQVVRTPSYQPQSVSLAQGQRKQELSIDIGNGVRLELVYVPAGRFMMGSQANKDQQPIHEVSVGAFYIGKYPITQIQYKLVMGNNPSSCEGENLPVESVSWHSAQKFCQKLTVKTGQRYRLPSEAEWEYAARGGNKSGGFTYAGSNSLSEVGWYGHFGGEARPVGQKKANELGIYDMSGNVWEWCEDVWHDNYNGAPANGFAWTAGGAQNRRVLRGGSWVNLANHCRVTTRLNSTSDNMFNMGFGFRVVLS